MVSRSSLSKVRGVVVDGLAVERHKAQLTTRMYHDHALIVEHLLPRAALAVGIGLLQVLEGFLVVAASTELVAHLEPVGVEGGTISKDEGRLWHSVWSDGTVDMLRRVVLSFMKSSSAVLPCGSAA